MSGAAREAALDGCQAGARGSFVAASRIELAPSAMGQPTAAVPVAVRAFGLVV